MQIAIVLKLFINKFFFSFKLIFIYKNILAFKNGRKRITTRKRFLNRIESRLNNLETSVEEILAKGDEFNEVTQEKLEKIQAQLERQSQNMRKIRRKLMHSYNPITVVIILVIIIILWLACMYYMVGE